MKNMILTEQKLVDTLRKRCDGAQKRIWIASPFIGNLKGVQQVIGGSWMQSSIDFQIVTDVDAGFIKNDTFSEFQKYGCKIKSLKSLHAKIYITDDWALITSANLTGTAFSKRYEVGIEVFDVKSLRDIEDTFCNLYNIAKAVKSISRVKRNEMNDYHDGTSFANVCKLPKYNNQNKINSKYFAKVAMYKDFADFYLKVTNRNKTMVKDGFTLYQEVDYLFNFLYHEHALKPSNKCSKPRIIADKQKELLKHFAEMSVHYSSDPQKLERVNRVQIVQNKINSKKVMSWDDIKDVAMCFHCYWSYPLNRHRFLNPKNNNNVDIDKYWKLLLRNVSNNNITSAKTNLRYFGDSALQELIGWYLPNDYPIMNTNSDCGMKYFGYHI